MKYLALFMVGIVLLLPVVANAGDVEAKVTREGADVYRVVGDDLFLFTEYCFEMSDSEKVFLRLEEGSNRIVFPKYNNICDIRNIYGQTSMNPGTYTVNVSRYEEGWYSVVGKGAVFKTDGCYSLVENVTAKAVISEDSKGTLFMPSVEEECRIEGIYVETKLKLVTE